MPTTHDTPAEAVALAVRQAILRQSSTVADAASAAGLSTVQLSRRLNGHVRWTVSEVAAVARAVGVPASILVATAFPEVGQGPAPDAA